MTEQEKIEALKVNNRPYGLLPKELIETLVKVGKKNLKVFNGVSWVKEGENSRFIDVDTYRIRIDYQPIPAEPEEIEYLIQECGGVGNLEGELRIVFPMTSRVYSDAPAFIPKPGYRFAGYRYEKWNDLCMFPVHNDDVLNKIVFPVAAVYRKLTS